MCVCVCMCVCDVAKFGMIFEVSTVGSIGGGLECGSPIVEFYYWGWTMVRNR